MGANDYLHRPTPMTTFDVRLLPIGHSEFSATPEVIRLVTVRAENSFGARFSPDVQALMASGYYVVEVTVSNGYSGVSAAAVDRARRVADAADVPADLRGANNAAPAGIPRFR